MSLIAEELQEFLPIKVIAEGVADFGLGYGVAMVPKTADASTANVVLLIDPIDGTRSLMYDKRSAWILTGAVVVQDPSRKSYTLADIDLAVQTEVPVQKQTIVDVYWACRGLGASAERCNLVTGEIRPLLLGPSGSTDIEHGFGQVSRSFPGARDILAAIDDEICFALLGTNHDGRPVQVFEDQYLSTAGQLAELMLGHDRWTVDLRPLLSPILQTRGQPPVLCAHSYDLATVLIAEEAGVIVREVDGSLLNAPLSVRARVSWAGFANKALQDAIQPVLRSALSKYGLLPQ
jgi:hypothetical protein